MTFEQFLGYASGPGISAIVGFVMAFILEVWPEFQNWTDRNKRFVSMGLAMVIPVLATSAQLVMYGAGAQGDLVELYWQALQAGFLGFFASQGTHGAFFIGKKKDDEAGRSQLWFMLVLALILGFVLLGNPMSAIIQAQGGFPTFIPVQFTPSGGPVSSAIDLTGYYVTGVEMPTAWYTATELTYQTSVNNGTFMNLYNASGGEYSTTVAVSTSVIIPSIDLLSARYLRLRSGTSDTPVTQPATTTVNLIVRPAGE